MSLLRLNPWEDSSQKLGFPIFDKEKLTSKRSSLCNFELSKAAWKVSKQLCKSASHICWQYPEGCTTPLSCQKSYTHWTSIPVYNSFTHELWNTVILSVSLLSRYRKVFMKVIYRKSMCDKWSQVTDFVCRILTHGWIFWYSCAKAEGTVTSFKKTQLKVRNKVKYTKVLFWV